MEILVNHAIILNVLPVVVLLLIAPQIVKVGAKPVFQLELVILVTLENF